MKTRDIAPFLGPITAIDATEIDENHASDVLNVLLEDGRIRPRYGFRRLDVAQTDFASAHGMEYLKGYDDNYQFQEEYVTFERLSTDTADKCKPYHRNYFTGAETVITDNGSSLSLDATSDWRGFPWNGDSYFANSAEGTVYKHEINNNDSFTALTVPDAPAAAPTVTVSRPPNTYLSFGNGSTGVHVTNDIAYTGLATATSSTQNSDGTVSINHTNSQGTASSFEITLDGAGGTVPGQQDWQYNDCFSFILTIPSNVAFDITPSSLVITYTTNTSVTYVADDVQIATLAIAGKKAYGVRLQFNHRNRNTWTGNDKIKKIKIAYSIPVGTTTGSRLLTLRQPEIGAVWMRGKASKTSFAYTFYKSAIDLESEISDKIDIPSEQLEGSVQSDMGAQFKGLGVWLTITTTESDDTAVDYNRYYVYDYETEDEEHPHIRRIVEQADSDLTYEYKLTVPEMQALPEYETPGPFPYDGIFAGVPYKAGVAWLVRGGYQNVKFSRIGNPEKLASTKDSLDDVNRGETFSLSDNFIEEPLNAHPCDDALLITSLGGVHAMIGSRPSEMTPPKKLPGSMGACGWQASCAWFDPNGNPGVVSVSQNLDGIYFHQVSNDFDGIRGSSVTELTQHIRPSVKAFLADAQGITDFTRCIALVEPNTDALWVILGKRAMRLSRANLISGRREWEFHIFNMPNDTIKFAVADIIRRTKWLRTNGQFDENEYRFDTGNFITGTNRDAGNPITSLYWDTKEFNGDRRRVLWVQVDRSNKNNTPTITVTSDGTAKVYVMVAQRDTVKMDITNVGRGHKVRLALSENDGYYNRLAIYESEPVGDRRFFA